MRVGLNALDSPEVNVAVLVPVSATAERDMRLMRQSVEMWGGGIDHLAEQMDMDWLAKGVNFNVTTKLVPVDANGIPTQAVRLVKPKIVVIATNPVGGIGIGIDPVDFAGELGITGEAGRAVRRRDPATRSTCRRGRSGRASTATTGRSAASTSSAATVPAARSASRSTAPSTRSPGRWTSSRCTTWSRTRPVTA